MDQGGEVRAELDSAVVPSVRGQPGASVSVRPGVQPWELPSPVMSAQGDQTLVAAERAGQAEGEYNHDLAKGESAPGSRLVFNAVSPHWRGPEDDKDGQEPWFTARIASLIG